MTATGTDQPALPDVPDTSDLPTFPFHASPTGVPAEYAERRAGCPMGRVRMPSGAEGLLLVTYADISAAVADPRFSHNLTAPGAPRATIGPSFLDDPLNIINREGEDHLRIRRIVASAFTPRRIARWKPTIEAVARELIDGIEAAAGAGLGAGAGAGDADGAADGAGAGNARQPFDIAAEYCFQLPVRIICKLLGVPEQDKDRFRVWSSAFIASAKMEPAEQYSYIMEFTEYVRGLLAAKRANPGTDLIDELIEARDGADRLSEEELVMLVTGLITGGNETTSNALGRALIILLDGDRALWESLVEDPDLIPAAVDELLRVMTLGNTGMLRVVTEDVELPSGLVHAGDTVVVATTSALRDEAVYTDPDEVRFGREAPPSLVFGGGAHYCLGAHLAKAEMQIGLSVLIERLPTLRLAVRVEDLEFSEGEILSSVLALPATW